MSRLFLSCGLCGRKQADGLISRSFWGHLDVGNGSALRACPTCKEAHSDWETRLRAAFQPPTGDWADQGTFGAGSGRSL